LSGNWRSLVSFGAQRGTSELIRGGSKFSTKLFDLSPLTFNREASSEEKSTQPGTNSTTETIMGKPTLQGEFLFNYF